MAKKLIDTEALNEELKNGVESIGNIGVALNGLLASVGDSNKGFKAGFRACHSAHGHITGLVKALERIESLAIKFNKHKETSPEKQARDITKSLKQGDISKDEAMKALQELINDID